MVHVQARGSFRAGRRLKQVAGDDDIDIFRLVDVCIHLFIALRVRLLYPHTVYTTCT